MAISTNLPYFPRPSLAGTIMTVATSGLVHGITMFAARRQGKTWFVTKELLPAFQNVGWDTLYVDLWRRRDNPEEGFVELLEEASPKGTLSTLLKPVKRVRVKVGVPGAGGEVEVDNGADKGLTLEQRLEKAFASLMHGQRRRLLVMDEFQVLAGATRIGFVSALRACLQQYQGRLFPVFTGSSRGALNSMFNAARAPLFNSAFTVPFPQLGRDFIVDRAAVLRARAPKLKLDVDGLFALFAALEHSPMYVNEMVMQALLHNTAVLEDIHAYWLIAKSEAEDYPGQLAKLTPLQLATLRALAVCPVSGQKKTGLYSMAMREAVQKLLPGKPITAARLQNAIQALIGLQLVASEADRGDYGVEDAGLKSYLANLGLQ